MDQLMKDKLATNIGALPKMASAWVMGLAGAMWAAYLALPVTCDGTDASCFSQHDLQAWASTTLHIPAFVFPLVVTLIGLAARIYPQKSLTVEEAGAKSAEPTQLTDVKP
jgi:hypothetical protein